MRNVTDNHGQIGSKQLDRNRKQDNAERLLENTNNAR